MVLFSRLCWIFLVFYSEGFVWPLSEREGLTSSFGEWRSGHLHAGIDLPINKIGDEVYSSVGGWVMRVKVSPWGYGKVVYIKSPEGEIFVYAHLSDFSSKLRKIVRSKQLRKVSYAVEIWFKKGEIPVEEGEIIAYAGRSGCSAPHLHFEWRDKNNNPIDPFVRGFNVPDTIPPLIKAVRFVPMDEISKISGSHIGRIFEPVSDTISVFIEGTVGIEIETVDRVNKKSGRLGPKEIRLYKNGLLIRREFVDRFSYSNYKDARFLFDFEYRMSTGRKFRRLFAVHGNGLPFYEGGMGIINGGSREYYSVEVFDGSGNKSRLVIHSQDSLADVNFEAEDSYRNKILFETHGFQVYGKWYDLTRTKKILKSGDSIKIWNLTKGKINKLRSPDRKFYMYLNKGDIINSRLIAVRIKSGETKIWKWEPHIPLKKKAKIKVRIPKNGKFCSLYEQNGKEWNFCTSKREGDYLVDNIDHLGSFGVLMDSMPPVVSLSRQIFSSKSPLKINLWDSLSGVDFYSIKTFIDGKQTVFRFDPQKKRLIFEHPEEISGGKHRLKLSLSDRQGNTISRVWQIIKK